MTPIESLFLERIRNKLKNCRKQVKILEKDRDCYKEKYEMETEAN